MRTIWTQEQVDEHNRRVAEGRRIQDRDTGAAPKLERHSVHGALATGEIQGADSGKFLVRATSFRKRLLDIDNLCEKFHVDCCRYAGIIPSDDPAKAQIEVCQVKALKGEEERTLIEVFRI